MRSFVSLTVVIALAGVARSEVDPLAAGAELAGQRRFNEAIVQFKLAHAAAPARPEPDCLIALAYRRLERWSQAKLFLTRCLVFSKQPDWVPDLVRDIDDGVAHAGLVEVTFAIEPPTAVTVTVGSFAADETFAPQPIVLPPGPQVITLAVAGYKPQQLTVEIPPVAPFVIRARLERVPGEPVVVRLPGSARSTTGYVIVAGAAAMVGIGVMFHVLAHGIHDDITVSAAAWDDQVGTFKTERAIAIGGYALGAVGLGLGIWMIARGRPVIDSRAVERWVTPTASPSGGGIAFGGSW